MIVNQREEWETLVEVVKDVDQVVAGTTPATGVQVQLALVRASAAHRQANAAVRQAEALERVAQVLSR